MTPAQIEFYKRLAHGLALQFGPNCEVVVHDLETEDVDRSIVVIENGHVSGRKLGDGPSHIVLESMHEGTADVHDREPYQNRRWQAAQVLDHLYPQRRGQARRHFGHQL